MQVPKHWSELPKAKGLCWWVGNEEMKKIMETAVGFRVIRRKADVKKVITAIGFMVLGGDHEVKNGKTWIRQWRTADFKLLGF